MQQYIDSYHLLHVALKNTKGTTCGKAGPSHTWSGGTIYGSKIAVDGPGDQLWQVTTCGMTGQTEVASKEYLRSMLQKLITFQFKKGSYYMMTDSLFQQYFKSRYSLNFTLAIRGNTGVSREHVSQYGGQVLVKI